MSDGFSVTKNRCKDTKYSWSDKKKNANLRNETRNFSKKLRNRTRNFTKNCGTEPAISPKTAEQNPQFATTTGSRPIYG